jgi:hypothetical protein
MPADARIEQQNQDYMGKVSDRFAKTENMRTIRLIDFRGDANVTRPPDYYIYIFNIAQRKFEVRRPPHFPLINFAGCPAGEPYALVGRVPNVVNEKWIDADSGETRVRGIQGERFATDLLNPSNIGIDIWGEVPEELSWIDSGGTDDLTRRGMFWSLNSEPAPEELARAKEKLEKHYRQLLQKADQLYSDPKTRPEISREHHLAADYFKVRSQWHIVAEVPSVCPNCGEAKPTGVPFHVSSIGTICIEPTAEAWRRAVLAGVKKKEDIPEELRGGKTPSPSGKMNSA